jgi:hypothetical protein
MYLDLRALGYEGSYDRVAAFARQWKVDRMLPPKGNPNMDNLAAIFSAVRRQLGVGLEVHTVEAHA